MLGQGTSQSARYRSVLFGRIASGSSRSLSIWRARPPPTRIVCSALLGGTTLCRPFHQSVEISSGGFESYRDPFNDIRPQDRLQFQRRCNHAIAPIAGMIFVTAHVHADELKIVRSQAQTLKAAVHSLQST